MRNLFIISSIVAAFFLTSISSYAGDWSDDQKTAWATVEKFWEAENKGDADTLSGLLSDDLKSWSTTIAMPRNKSSNMGWFRFGFENGKGIKYEISPVGVVVHGDMALVHYYYVSITEDKDGKRESNNGRWSDVLVRDGKSWKFIGWQGGPDSDDE